MREPWYTESHVYIPKERLVEAAGHGITEREIAKALKARGFLKPGKSPTHKTVNWIPKIGDIPAYALTRPPFGRTHLTHDPSEQATQTDTEPEGPDPGPDPEGSPFKVHQGGRT